MKGVHMSVTVEILSSPDRLAFCFRRTGESIYYWMDAVGTIVLSDAEASIVFGDCADSIQRDMAIAFQKGYNFCLNGGDPGDRTQVDCQGLLLVHEQLNAAAKALAEKEPLSGDDTFVGLPPS